MPYAKLLVQKHYPAAWVFRYAPMQIGEMVPVVPASNLPGKDRYWVNNDLLKDDPYGVLLEPGEYVLLDEEGE